MKMKKIIALVAVATMVVSAMVGCGSTGKVETNTEANTEVGSDETDADSTEVTDTETDAEEGEESAPSDGNTVANTLYDAFLAEVENATDLETLANAISTNEVFSEVSMTTMVVEPGFLNGFQAEINGFNNGVMVSPMIGTIPFVCYIFEADDTAALVTELEANHQLNWNICTAADEMLVKEHDNYVFFVMSPYNFEG